VSRLAYGVGVPRDTRWIEGIAGEALLEGPAYARVDDPASEMATPLFAWAAQCLRASFRPIRGSPTSPHNVGIGQSIVRPPNRVDPPRDAAM
jgi:hypothetical protein